MLRARASHVRNLVVLLGMLLGGGATGLAQDEDKPARFREPGVDYRQESSAKPYIDWLFGALLIAGSAFLLFKNPHRSHMD